MICAALYRYQLPITSLLKIFVWSRRDWKEKMPGRIPTLPLLQSLRLRKPIATFCALLMYCLAHPWRRGGGGGELCWEGRGKSKAWNDDVGVMMKWSAFYILFTKEFSRAWEEHILLLVFALLWDLCFTPCTSYFGSWNKNWRKVLAELEKNETLGASWNYLRQTFASEEKWAELKIICAKPLRLMKN